MKKYIAFILAVTLTIFCFGPRVFAQPEPTPQPLYERLGGINGLAQVVDDFVNNLLQNEVINKNPKVKEGMGKISPAALKFHITAFIGESTGGPEKYTGKSMKDAHVNLGIGEAEWKITVELLSNSLKKFGIAEKEQNELILVVGITKPDVVTAKEAPVQAPPQIAPTAPQAPPPEAQVAPPAPAPEPEPQLVPLLPSEEAQAAPPAPPPSVEIKPAFPEPIPPAQAAPKEIKEESGFPEFADPAP